MSAEVDALDEARLTAVLRLEALLSEALDAVPKASELETLALFCVIAATKRALATLEE